jgi:secreted trypsin-like serine protease
MKKFVTAAVVGGAALAIGVVPAASAAFAITAPTPIPVPVGPVTTSSPTTTPQAPPTHPKKHRKHRKPVSHKRPTHHPIKRKPVVHKPAPSPIPSPVPSPTPAPTPVMAPQSGQPRIIGGEDAGDAPWAVQVSWDDTGFECTGTAIAAQWVLTSAHCVNTDNGGMTVLIGSPNLGEGTEDTVDDKEVDPDGDLALLHLADPVQTKYAPLADEDPEVGSTNEIYGWGKTSPTSGPSAKLKTATVQVTDLDCTDGMGGEAICSTGIDGTAFNGDSGGPEMADGVEVGVCSTGNERTKTQEYTSIAANRDWIQQVANV